MKRTGGESVGELLGDRLHSGGGDGRVAVGEHAEDDVEHATAVGEFGVELDAADEGSEEALDDRVGESGVGQRSARRGVVALEEPDRVNAAQAMAQPGNAGLVEQRTDRSGHGRQRGRGSAERVADDGALPVAPDERARIERSEVERCHVELAVHLGICGERDLETAVEREAVDVVGADSAADAVARLVHLHGDPGVVERDGARQARRARRRRPRPARRVG